VVVKPAVRKEAAPLSISRSISVARVICIFFVMYVHVWPGTAHFDPARGIRGLDIFYHFFSDILGRSSVPLLSVVSGWLVGRSFAGAWGKLIRSRVTSLLVPLFLWNLLLLLALWIGARAGWEPMKIEETPLGIANALFALTEESVNIPLAFLRDLFVCVCLSPILIFALRRGGRPALIALGVLVTAYAIFGTATPFLLRPMILTFFFAGLALAIHKVDVGEPVVKGWAIALAIVTAGTIFVFDVERALLGGSLEWWDPRPFVLRVAVAYLFWCVAYRLAQSAFGRRFVEIQPYIFFVFCSHVIALKVLVLPGKALFGDYYSPNYIWYFLLQPPAALVIGVTLALLLARYAPAALRPLNAGKMVPTQLYVGKPSLSGA
jgi:hypothetical protein